MKKLLLALLLLLSSSVHADDEFVQNYYRKIALHYDKYHREYLIIQNNAHIVIYSVQPIVLHNKKIDTIQLTQEDFDYMVKSFLKD
jgi:hypothetical protein